MTNPLCKISLQSGRTTQFQARSVSGLGKPMPTMKIMAFRLFLATLLLLQIAPAQAPKTDPKIDSLNDFSRSIRSLTQKVSPAVVQIVVSGYGSLDEKDNEESTSLTR